MNRYWIRKILEKHEELVWKFVDYFNLTDYQAWWLAFVKGFIFALILVWIF